MPIKLFQPGGLNDATEIPSSITVYNETATQTGVKIWTGTATVAGGGGMATFYPTVDGTGNTASLFSEFFYTGFNVVVAGVMTPQHAAARLSALSGVSVISMGFIISSDLSAISVLPDGATVSCLIIGK